MVSENYEENIEDHEDEYSWDEIEIVYGRLIKISRVPWRKITLEVEEEPGSSRTDIVQISYNISEQMSEEDFNDLRELIDEDVKVKLQDGEVVSVSRNLY